jgi:hypothetical protein
MIYYYASLKWKNIETSDNVFQWLISYRVSCLRTNVPFYSIVISLDKSHYYKPRWERFFTKLP